MSDETREPAQDDSTAEEPSAEELEVAEGPAEKPGADEASGELSDTGKIAAIRDALDDESSEDAVGDDEPTDLADEPGVGTGTEAEATESDDAVPAEMDMGPERRSHAWVWVGFVIALLMVAGAVGYAWWYTTSRAIAVPDIVGLVPAQAVQTLNDVDLRLGEVSEEVTDSAPAGTILSQTPEALETAKPGDSVSFVVAAPPDTTEVPDVVGRTAELAAQDLAKAKLAAFKVELYDANVADGFVISQLPSAGVELSPGTNVAIAVSTGPPPEQFRVPRLVGLSESDAAALLDASGLRGAVFRSYDASMPPGEVFAQAPAAGTAAASDAIVQYIVNSGPGAGPGDKPVTVPDVAGKTEADAKKVLKEAPLKTKVRRVSHPNVPKGTVISQMPLPGSKAKPDSEVGVLVSKGSLQRVPVPDLMGLSDNDAEAAAKSAGLLWLPVKITTSEQPAGLVFAQYPAVGTEWPLRFPVIGAIAKAPQ